jgi:hypothetical protein
MFDTKHAAANSLHAFKLWYITEPLTYPQLNLILMLIFKVYKINAAKRLNRY